MFNFENISALPNTEISLRIEEIAVKLPIALYDLTAEFSVKDDKLHGLFNYNTDVFDRTTIQRMVGHFIRVLERKKAPQG